MKAFSEEMTSSKIIKAPKIAENRTESMTIDFLKNIFIFILLHFSINIFRLLKFNILECLLNLKILFLLQRKL